MTDISTAEAMLSKISTANNEVAQIQARIQDKKATLAKLLSSAEVSSIEELQQKIQTISAQLESELAKASSTYEENKAKIEEAKACLAN